MMRGRKHWSDVVAAVGQAGLDLVRAEYGVVASDIKSSGRTLVSSLLLLLAGLFALFWAIGALALVLVEVGSLWLPRWGAALAVLALFLLVGLILAIVARRRLRSIELPADTVRRRLDEHRDWWQQRIADTRPARRRGGYVAAEPPASAEDD